MISYNLGLLCVSLFSVLPYRMVVSVNFTTFMGEVEPRNRNDELIIVLVPVRTGYEANPCAVGSCGGANENWQGTVSHIL